MLKRKSFSVGVIRGLVLFLLVTGGTVTGQECIATGDVDCTGGALPSSGDIGELQIYLSITFGSLGCPYEADFTGDSIIDGRDLDTLLDYFACQEGCFLYWSVPTSCEPLMIYSTAMAQPLGESSVSRDNDYVTVTGVGMTGGDGVRLYPNMEGDWQHGVNYILDNISLSTDGAEVNFVFTGAGDMALRWPLSEVDSSQFLDRVVEAGVASNGGQLELSVDFLWDDIQYVEVLALDGGTASGSFTIGGNGTMMTGDLQAGALSVTEVSLSLSDSTALTMRFDRPVEFTYSSVPPVPLFTADELRFVAVNVIQPTVGVGPLDITASGFDWFGVHPPSCCEGHVGNANGQGGEEPTIGDVSVMIDAKFITGTCDGILPCLAEADINRSGGCHPTCDDITIGDIASLIDCLFISGCPPWSISSPCLVCPPEGE